MKRKLDSVLANPSKKRKQSNGKALQKADEEILSWMQTKGFEGEVCPEIFSFLPPCCKCGSRVQTRELSIKYKQPTRQRYFLNSNGSIDRWPPRKRNEGPKRTNQTWCRNCLADPVHAEETRNIFEVAVDSEDISQLHVLYKWNIEADNSFPKSCGEFDSFPGECSKLQYALEKNKTKAIEFLLKAKADPNEPIGRYNQMHPMLAIASGEFQIGNVDADKSPEEALKFLIKYGADVNVTDDEGQNFAHYAIDNMEVDNLSYILRAITSAGGDINHRDKNGDNAWHSLYKREESCLEGCQLRILGKLIDAGLKTSVPDGEGKHLTEDGLCVSWDVFDYLRD